MTSPSPLYSLDIGFDREALPRPDSEPDRPVYPLDFGITVAGDEHSNPVAQSRNMITGGRIRFTLYDLTRYVKQTLTSPVEWLSFRIRFHRGRRSTQTKSPLSEAVAMTFSIRPDPRSPIKSTVFSTAKGDKSFPNWNVFSPLDSRGMEFAEFPHNQLIPDPMPAPEGIELLHKGYFYFSMSLDIGWRQGGGLSETPIRHYRTDPEMILSGDG